MSLTNWANWKRKIAQNVPATYTVICFYIQPRLLYLIVLICSSEQMKNPKGKTFIKGNSKRK